MAKKRKHKFSGTKPKLIGPGVYSQIFGRWEVIRSKRTPEEQAQLMAKLKSFRQDFPWQAAKKVSELEKIITNYNSFELLAALTAEYLFYNAETYKETRQKHGDALVEFATLLCLKKPFNQGSEPPYGSDFDRLAEGLKEVVLDTMSFYNLEFLDDRFNDPLKNLQCATKTSELIVRNPGYHHHLVEMLASLFEPFGDYLEKEFGFDIGDIIKVESSLHSLILDRFHNSRTTFKQLEAGLIAKFYNFRQNGLVSEPHKALFLRLADFSDQKAEEVLSGMHAALFIKSLGKALSYTPTDLGSVSGLPPNRVEAILKFFSLSFESVPSDFHWPTPKSPLKLQPFIRHQDVYMCPNPQLFAWAIRPQLEKMLNPTTRLSTGTKALWEKYTIHRSGFLERESLRLIASCLKDSQVYHNLEFNFQKNGAPQPGELDGLIVFEGTAILVEAKAGIFSVKARGGYDQAIKENLKKLVSEGHSQALKARDYIANHTEAVFLLEDGKEIKISRNEITHTVMVIVTLEPLDVFCTNLHQTADLGLFPSGELPWVVPILDLRVIAETIEFPSQLIHYLRRRLRVHEIKKLEAYEELDWFGCYLSDGLNFDSYAQSEATALSLASFTTPFDDWYFYSQGLRKTPSAKPQAKLPELFRQLAMGIDRTPRRDRVNAVCLLLDFPNEAKDAIAKIFQEQLKQCKRTDTTRSFSFHCQAHDIGVSFVISPGASVAEASFTFSSYVEEMKYSAKCSRWLGILCISNQPNPLGSWLLLEEKWKENKNVSSPKMTNTPGQRWKDF